MEYVLFLVLIFGVVCLVANAACVTGLSMSDCPFFFSSVLFEMKSKIYVVHIYYNDV